MGISMPSGPLNHDQLLSKKRHHEQHVAGLLEANSGQPPIENVVFEGGGAKGIVYCGAIQAMESHESNMTAGVKRVAGSSAGSMVAMLWAIGYNAKQIEQQITEDLDFTELQDQRCQWDPKVPGPKGIPVGISTIINLFKHKGAFKGDKFHEIMASLIREKIEEKLIDYVKLAFADKIASEKAFCNENGFDAKMTQDRIRRLIEDKVEQLKDELEITDSGEVTFGQLKKLNEKFEPYPEIRGYDLYVTGTRLTDGSLQVFSHESDPNMPVVLATQISACFPGGFEPIYYKGHFWADGGIADNAPVKIFDNEKYLSHGRNKAGANPCTLCYLVDSEDEIKQRWGQHKPKPLEKLSLGSYIGQIVSAYHSRLEELKRLHNETVVQIWDTGIETMELDIDEEKKLKAIHAGSSAANEFLRDHYAGKPADQARQTQDIYQIYFQMTEAELLDRYQSLGHELAELAALIDTIDDINVLKEQERISNEIKAYARQSADHLGEVAAQEALYGQIIQHHEAKIENEEAIQNCLEEIDYLSKRQERLNAQWAVQLNFLNVSLRGSFTVDDNKVVDQLALEGKITYLKLQEAKQKLAELKDTREALALDEQKRNEAKKEPLFDLICQRENLSNIMAEGFRDALDSHEQVYHEHLDVLLDVMEAKGLTVSDPRMESDDHYEPEADLEAPPAAPTRDDVYAPIDKFAVHKHHIKVGQRLSTGNWGDSITSESQADLVHNQTLDVSESGETYGRKETNFDVRRHITYGKLKAKTHDATVIKKTLPFDASILTPEPTTLQNPKVPVKEIQLIFRDPTGGDEHKRYGQMKACYKTRESTFEQVKAQYLQQIKWAIRKVKEGVQPEDAKILLTISGRGMGAMDAQLMLAALVEHMNMPEYKDEFLLDKIELSVSNPPKVSEQLAKSFADSVQQLKVGRPSIKLDSYAQLEMETKDHFVPECYFGQRSLTDMVSSDIMTQECQARSKQSKRLIKRWDMSDPEHRQHIGGKLHHHHRFYSSSWYRHYASIKQQGRLVGKWLNYSFPKGIAKLALFPFNAVQKMTNIMGAIPYYGIKGLGRVLKRKFNKKNPKVHPQWRNSLEAALVEKQTPSPEGTYGLTHQVNAFVTQSAPEKRLQMSARPPIENVVFGGGGINNVAMIGALKSMEDHGHLKEVKRLAGSSFGALMATLVAVGFSPDEIEDIFLNVIRLADIADPDVQWDPTILKYKGHHLGFSSIYSLFKYKGLYKGEAFQAIMGDLLVNKMEANLKHMLLKQFSEHELAALVNGYKMNGSVDFNAIVDKIMDRELKKILDEFGIEDIRQMTFGQLQALNEAYPELQLKEIFLTGTRLSTGEMKEFSHTSEPDMPILKALGISMAIPFAMQPVAHDGDVYVSGDTSDLYPVSIFDREEFLSHGRNDSGVNPCTLGMMVENHDTIMARWGLTQEQKKDISLSKFAARVLQGMRNRTEDLNRYDVNTVQIENVRQTKELFAASYDQKRAMIDEGRATFDNYFELYWPQDAVYQEHQSYANMMHKYYGMTEAQLIRIHQQEVKPLILEAQSLMATLDHKILPNGIQIDQEEVESLEQAIVVQHRLDQARINHQRTLDVYQHAIAKVQAKQAALDAVTLPYSDVRLEEWPADVIECRARLESDLELLKDNERACKQVADEAGMAAQSLQMQHDDFASILGSEKINRYEAYKGNEHLKEIRDELAVRLSSLELEESYIMKALSGKGCDYQADKAVGKLPKLPGQQRIRHRELTSLRDLSKSRTMMYQEQQADDPEVKSAKRLKNRLRPKGAPGK